MRRTHILAYLLTYMYVVDLDIFDNFIHEVRTSTNKLPGRKGLRNATITVSEQYKQNYTHTHTTHVYACIYYLQICMYININKYLCIYQL